MNKQEILENNKLIVEFMEIKKEIISTNNIHSWSDAPYFYTTENLKEKVIENIVEYSKYHEKWDWLMPVVEKIENIDVVASVQIEQPTIYIWKSSIDSTFEDIEIDIFKFSKLEAVYKAVIEFIKWYNKK